MAGKLRLGPKLEIPADEAVTQTFGILAKRGAGKSNAAAVMAEEMHRAGHHFVAIDPVGAWWGLRSSSDGKSDGLPVPILGGYHGDIPLEPTGGELVADLVVSERALMRPRCLRVRVRDGETTLFRAKGKPGRDDPMHLFLEEADDYIPQRSPGEVARVLGAFQRIVKQGRARGLGSTMITQRSAAINKDVLTQIETLIVLRTTSPTDRKAIEGWVTYHDADRDILSTLSTLKPGEAWIWSPSWLELIERVQIRRRETFDSGATPTRRTKTRAPATLADVDLGALEESMKDTIKRQKSEDPRELRKRIIELERKLRERPEPAPVEPERIEVPVLDDDDRKTLDELLEAMAGVQALADEFKGKLSVLQSTMDVSRAPLAAVIRTVEEEVAHPQKFVTPGVVLKSERAWRADHPPGEGRLAPKPTLVSGGTVVPPSQRRILDTLAALRDIGTDPAPKVQVALFAGASPRSSTYTNNLGALRTAGLIAYPSPGAVALTKAGAELADGSDAPASTQELQHRVYELVGPSRSRILAALVHVWPESLSKAVLAERVQASASSSTYTNNLGSLRSLGLIDYPEPGFVVAREVLFLEGR